MVPLFRLGAGNGTRTRDPNLGKVVLYQLSYSRVTRAIQPELGRVSGSVLLGNRRTDRDAPLASGGEGNRTPDLLNAIQALSQLSYAPEVSRRVAEASH